MLLSVCVVNYNNSQYLNQCITSIINQSFMDFEIIIIDDYSKDDSCSILEYYQSLDKRIKLYKNKVNIGPAKSAERAYNMCLGKYICTVDSDDYLDIEAFNTCINIIESFKEVGLVYTYSNYDINGYIRINPISYVNINNDINKLKERFSVHHLRIFKSSLWFNTVGSFEVNKYCYDYELCLKLLTVTNFYKIKLPLYYYRKHFGQITQNKSIIKERYNDYLIAKNCLNK